MTPRAPGRPCQMACYLVEASISCPRARATRDLMVPAGANAWRRTVGK